MNRPARLSLLLPLAAAALLVAACASPTGSLGPVPTTPPTSAPSIEPPSAEPTPNPTSTPSGAPSGSPSPTTGPVVSPSPSPTGTTTVRAYFFKADPATGEPGLVPVLREVPATVAVGRAAMEELLAGPSGWDLAQPTPMTTTIPSGTSLLGLSIADDIATVDLSAEFQSGGGSESITGRVAQVVYTLTQFPTVDQVLFEIDGQPVSVLGGEGLMLDQPVGRGSFYESLPEIFVDRPAWGAAIGNPARVTGLTRVFEATFRVAILDQSGRVLADERAMATCGTGCWGSFDVTLRYSVTKAQWGTLRVYDLSAKDGSPENTRDYLVWLTR